MSLPYTPPYDREAMLSVFRAHQLPHLECVDALGYERVVRTARGMAWFRVTHDQRRHRLRFSISNAGEEDITPISTAVRRMFDLDANPTSVGAAMNADPCLAMMWRRHSGLGVARTWSPFETMLTTVLGQLVSVSFGRTLVDELMKAAGQERATPKPDK